MENTHLILEAAKRESKELNVGKEEAKAHSIKLSDISAPTQSVQLGKQQSEKKAKITVAEMLGNHPGYAAYYNNKVRRTMLSLYGDMLPMLNLKPEEMERLKGLIVDQMNIRQQAALTLQSQGLKPGSPEYVDAMKRIIAEDDMRTEILLGSEKMEFLKEIPAIVKYRRELETEYSVNFQSAGAPLTDSENQKLAELMAGKFGHPNLRKVDVSGTMDKPELQDDERELLEEATRFLEPNKIECLRQIFLEEKANYIMSKQYPHLAGRQAAVR